LQSLADQERLPDEVVVQDDGSTDGTVDLIRHFAETAPFPVRLEINQARVGSTANFAIALARCQGEFIALADQDDVWYPAKLRRLEDELAGDPTVTLVFSNADLIGEQGQPLGPSLWEARRIERLLAHNAVVAEELFARRALTTGCTMAVRRRAVDAALPFPDELNHRLSPMRHDRWLSLVAAAVGTVRALPEPLLAFRVHESQETGVLVGNELPRALGRAVVGAFRSAPEESAESSRARAAQLRAAGRRAEEVGDFAEAEVLRRVAGGYELRGGTAGSPIGRLKLVVLGLRQAAYDPTPVGAAGVAADVVRALRPRHGGPGTEGSQP
jgi:glycosyltransferase involved in cell wall biosynthesis